MTETELKLSDAAAQIDLAAAHSDNEDIVRSCINAFISTARSVTFVMQKESGGSRALEAWYAERMAALSSSPSSALLRFFNESRVHSIHRGVVAPEKLTAQVTDFKMNGVVAGTNPTVIFYRFVGVGKYIPGGSGGVFRLCTEYLAILRGLVAEWLSKRAELGTR